MKKLFVKYAVGFSMLILMGLPLPVQAEEAIELFTEEQAVDEEQESAQSEEISLPENESMDRETGEAVETIEKIDVQKDEELKAESEELPTMAETELTEEEESPANEQEIVDEEVWKSDVSEMETSISSSDTAEEKEAERIEEVNEAVQAVVYSVRSATVQAETSKEELNAQGFVKGLYQTLLGRNPDQSGLNSFVKALNNGTGTASSTAWNIVNSSEFAEKKYTNSTYVAKLYEALLKRTPGKSEVSFWVSYLEKGLSRRFVLAQIVNSTEFSSVCKKYQINQGNLQITENRDKNAEITAYVSRCYQYILGRNADVTGLNTWTGKLLAGCGGAEIVKDLIESSEFQGKKKSAGEIIDILYQAMLGRKADAVGRADWINCVRKGVSNRYLINGFAGSEEFKALCAQYGIAAGQVSITEDRDRNIGVAGFVTRNYRTVLGRKSDTAGLNHWCGNILNGTLTPAQVSYGFVFSTEAMSKNLSNADFVEMLYGACLGRTSDAVGKVHWINILNAGSTREDVFWGFANSSEFQMIVAGYGLAGSDYTGIGLTEEGYWYIRNGVIDYDYVGMVTFDGKQYYVRNGKATLIGEQVQLSNCEVTSVSGTQLKVAIHTSRNGELEALAVYLYIVMLDSQDENVLAYATVSSAVGTEWVLSGTFNSSDSYRAAMMSKYALAVKVGQEFQVLSTSSYLSNPEITASTTKSYPGFYEGVISSKKGMQGVHANATEDLGIQAALLNINLNELIKTSTNVAKNGSACYVPYTYKGKTYYFHDMISYMTTVKGLNGWTGEYGAVRRNVSLNLLLGWDDELQYLIHPSARVAGHSYYALNMVEKDARETFEALFCYMAERLGGSVLLPSEQSTYKYRVANWILGNEVNACKVWHYSGGLSTQECADNYAEAFQLLYQGVKRTDSEARIFISLDHDWNAGENGHGGKAFLDEFAAYMHTTASHMRWNVNYHPYSQPLTRNDFWNDYTNTTSSISTRFISMRNLDVLTNYLGELESKYFPGKGSGYIRVILGEQGFSAANTSQEASQAAAVGYGFYIASMNTRVDAYIIRAYKDDPSEGVMRMGVMYSNEDQKESYNVYKALGTSESMTCLNGYLHIVNGNASSWTQVIPGLNLDALYRRVG